MRCEANCFLSLFLQVVEEQCEVVADENWGSFVHLTVDGQNNVIFLDDGQVVNGTVDGSTTTTVLIEDSVQQEPEQPPQAIVVPVTRQRAAPKAKVTRRSAAAAAAAAAATPKNGSSSSGEVDLLSFVQSAGVMVQHILDIGTDNS